MAIDDGYHESSQSWRDCLLSLKQRGLTQAPELAIGDGAMGFWSALREVFPNTKEQRCWVHKTANVLNCLPKALHEQAKHHIHQIWMAPDKTEACKAKAHFKQLYQDKYPKATAKIEAHSTVLLSFYDFPAKHWASLRTTNVIESVFATVKHRTYKAKGCLSRNTALAMAFKLIMSAQNR